MAGLVGYWPLNDGSGPSAADLSGNNYDGAFAGTPGPSWATLDGLACADFPGSGVSRIDLPSNLSDAYELSGEASVCAWVRVGAFTNPYGQVFGTKADTGFASRFDLYVKSNGKLDAIVSVTGAPELNYDGTGTYTLNVNEWTFVAMTCGPSVGMNGYVNGQLDKNVAHAQNIYAVAPAITMHLGAHVNYGHEFDGGIREVRVFDRALSATEILFLYQGSRAGFLNVEW